MNLLSKRRNFLKLHILSLVTIFMLSTLVSNRAYAVTCGGVSVTITNTTGGTYQFRIVQGGVNSSYTFTQTSGPQSVGPIVVTTGSLRNGSSETTIATPGTYQFSVSGPDFPSGSLSGCNVAVTVGGTTDCGATSVSCSTTPQCGSICGPGFVCDGGRCITNSFRCDSSTGQCSPCTGRPTPECVSQANCTASCRGPRPTTPGGTSDFGSADPSAPFPLLTFDPANIVSAFAAVLIPLAISLAALRLLQGFYMIMTCQGDEQKLQEGKDVATSAVVGGIFGILGLSILRIVINTFLN